jgi:hypothetical protein
MCPHTLPYAACPGAADLVFSTFPSPCLTFRQSLHEEEEEKEEEDWGKWR